MKLLQQLCFAAVCAASIIAADGVTLIDQRAAMAGKVTSGDTAGFPVTISQSGSYKLTGNLTVPDAMTTAIQITADDVMLDLNGFAIIGPNTCSGKPVPTGGHRVKSRPSTRPVVAPDSPGGARLTRCLSPARKD